MTLAIVAVAEHQLTILGVPTGRQGLCRCSWATDVEQFVDRIGELFASHLAHVRSAREVVLPICDVCQREPAEIRHGVVELCAACALDEIGRHHLEAVG